MSKGRLEAFSDGVIAILITIMVLELKAPHEPTFGALRDMLPVFLSYILSFAMLGIYWNNHHHMLHATEGVNGAVLLANLHLLFWLSLFPLVTSWMGEHYLAPLPTAMYGAVAFVSGVSYLILQRAIIRHQGPHSKLAAMVNRDFKGKFSAVAYAAAILLAFVHARIAQAIYVGVAFMWLVPDTRIESTLRK